MGGAGEGGVEGEDGAGAAEAVAGEVQFGHCVDCGCGVSCVAGLGGGGQLFWRRGKESMGARTVLKVEFDGRTVGRFAHPYVEVFSLPSFEE